MFRFTIRDVLWLMIVVGLAVGWWLDKRALTRAQTQVHTLKTLVVAHIQLIEDTKRAKREHVALLEDQLESLAKELAEKNQPATVNCP